jgi:hypothetical protein
LLDELLEIDILALAKGAPGGPDHYQGIFTVIRRQCVAGACEGLKLAKLHSLANGHGTHHPRDEQERQKNLTYQVMNMGH